MPALDSGPVGKPQQLFPALTSKPMEGPLFTPQQVQMLEDGQRRASHLYATPERKGPVQAWVEPGPSVKVSLQERASVQMQRRRLQQQADGSEVPVPETPQRALEDVPASGLGQAKGPAGLEIIGQEVAAMPALDSGPVGKPQQLFPALTSKPMEGPLFTPQQVQMLEDGQRRASHLYATPERKGPVQAWVEPGPSVKVSLQERASVQMQMELQELREHRKKMDEERDLFMAMFRSMQEENLRLRVQLSDERDQRYSTPQTDEAQEAPRVAEVAKPAETERWLGGAGIGVGAEAAKPAETRVPTGMVGGAEGTKPAETEVLVGNGGQCSEDEPSDDGDEEIPSRGASKRSQQQRSMDIMLKLMQGMQKMQKQFLDAQQAPRKSRAVDQEDEYVRGNVELHKLAEWTAASAPVDLQDWLLVIHPQMSDLSQSSAEWWSLTMEEAQAWYRRHQEMKPLEKLKHEVKIPQSLATSKWARVEKRACSMLLQAIPESQKEDIIAAKALSVMGIITRLLVNYQPGGAHEKTAVLLALESPAESTSIGDAITSLRRWLRWKRRAVDINVSLPDPMVLLRGLDRMLGRVLQENPALQFRINLARSTLLVDSTPTMTTVEQLAEYTMAELDQLSYSKKKEKAGAATGPAGRIKKIEEARPEEDGSRVQGKPSKAAAGKCRFYLTDEGCRRGRGCKFSHEGLKDQHRRCWTCGSTQHLSNKCPIGDGTSPEKQKTGGDSKGQRAQAARVQVEDDDRSSEKAVAGAGEDMRVLLEEAGPYAEADECLEFGDNHIRRSCSDFGGVRCSHQESATSVG